MMNEAENLVAFSLENRQFALHLSAVERVIHAVEVTPLPKAPKIVLGILNLQGRVIPVINIRARFRLPERGIELTDHFIIARTARRTVALVVDSVASVIQPAAQEIISAEEILPNMEYVEGVVKIEGEMILIHDLEQFLSLEEERLLDEAVEEVLIRA